MFMSVSNVEILKDLSKDIKSPIPRSPDSCLD